MSNKIKHLAVLAGLALVLTTPTTATAVSKAFIDAAPSLDQLTAQDKALLRFEPGQWQFVVTINGKIVTGKICFDALLSERFIDMGRIGGMTSCDKAVLTKTPDGFTLHSVCKVVREQRVTTDVERHIIDPSHFTQKATVVWTKLTTGHNITDVSETKASRLGACPLFSQPGDLEGDDGYRVNLYELMYVPKEGS